MLRHVEWLTGIARTVLKKTETSVEDYIDTVTTPGYPIDAVCILVIARMFHIHIAVFLKSGAWSTSPSKSLKACRFALIFHGNNEYSEAVKTSDLERYDEWLDEYTKKGYVISHLRTAMPGYIPPPPKRELPMAQTTHDTDDTVSLEDSDEARPEMDLPVTNNVLNVPSVPAVLKDCSSHQGDSDSDVIFSHYQPAPQAPRQLRVSGEQACPICGSKE